MKANIFPIGLTIIAIVTFTAMYFFPYLILGIFTAMTLFTVIFTGYCIHEAENAPKADQDFDVKFRRDEE